MSYRYFLLGDSVPVRVVFDARGQKIGAETPDPRTGQLVARVTLLSRLEQSYEVEEISETEFRRRCRLATNNRP